MEVSGCAYNFKMNQRQRKKQFKKKYGVTPAQALESLSDIIKCINDAIPQAMETIARSLNETVSWLENNSPKITEEVCMYVREHSAGIEED